MIIVLRDITKVVDNVHEIVSKVHSAIIEPLRALDYVIEKVKPYIEMAVERRAKSKQQKGKK